MLNPKRLFAFLRDSPPDEPFARGVRALETGHADEAYALFTSALHGAATDAHSAHILNKRGVALVALARKDEAVGDFISALEHTPGFVPTVVNIGNLLLEENALDEAIEHYLAALRSDDTYAFAHRNLAVAYRRAGRRSDAVRSLRTAMRLETRSWWPPWQREVPPRAR